MKKLKTLYSNTVIKNICVIILFCLLLMFFYSNRVFLTGVNSGEDLCEQEIPHASFFISTLKKGALPLWNPYKICGLPFLEIPFMGPYYPFVFLYFLFPTLKAINLGFLIHILLSGIFMFFLTKELKFTTLISFFCASSWMLSSVFQQYSESGWLTEAISASYLPGLIYFFVKMTKSKYRLKIIFGLLMGWCIALTILGGKPDYSVVTLYSFLIFSIPSLKQKNNGQFLLIILLTGLLLSIITWGPMLIQAMRYGWIEKLETTGYRINQMMNFLLPTEIRRGFVGKLVFILGFVGIVFRKTPFKINFILLLFSALFFMFADIKIGEIELIGLIPLAKQTDYLWIWHTSFIFSLIIFSGVSLDKLRLWLIDRKKMLFVILCLVFGVQLTDLYYFNKKFYPKGFDYTIEEYFPNQPFVDFFKKDSSLFRISNRLYCHFTSTYDLPLFRVNQGMLEEINCFESRIKGINLYKVSGKNSLTAHVARCPSKRAMDICNIKYIITYQDLLSDHFTKRLSIQNPDNWGRIYLYRNNFSFPRAFLLENIDRNAVKKVLFNNYTTSLLQLEISDEAWNMLSNYKDVDIIWSPNTYTISVESESSNFLFLSEMKEFGWRVELDGSPIEIFSPFNFFMGVFLPPGKHLITFQFDPLYFYIFSIISITTFLVSTFIMIFFIIIEIKLRLSNNRKQGAI